ncbi:hypothetical protein BIY24_00695 [Halobacteriovorax marinus]|nr:hypothetical protein BIY24_00695 [Halobacteriovorax marinus]
MNKLNKILILFSIFTAFLIMSTWRFVQSEYFGSIITKEINKNISKKLDIDLRFSNVEIEMFPPSTKLKNVTILSSREDYKVDISAGSLLMSFAISDLFENKFSIDKVGFEDAIIDLSELKTTGGSKSEELKPEELFPLVKDLLYEKLPVKISGILLERTSLKSNYLSGDFKKLDVDIYNSVIEASISGYDLEFSNKIIKESKLRELDYLSIEFHLNEDKLLLKKSEIWKGTQSASISGALIFGEKLRFDGDGNFRGMLDKLSFLKSNEIYKDINPRGVIELKSKINTDLKSVYNLDGSVRVIDLESNYAKVESAYVDFQVTDKEIVIEEALVEDRGGSIEIKERHSIYSFLDSKISNESVPIIFKNFHTNSLLFFIKEELDILKGRLNGTVDSRWNDEKLVFNIREESSLDFFKLQIEDKTPILQNSKVKINNSLIDVTLDGVVNFDFDIAVGNETKLKGNGIVDGENVNFNVSKSKANFEEIGPIAGLPLFGSGDFAMTIKGGGADVNFDFDLNMSKVKILDFNIQKLKGKLGLNLEDLLLSVKGVTGDFKGTSYNSSGFIDFDKNKINLGIDVRKSDLEDALFILEPIVKDIEFLKSKYLDLSFKSKVKLTGGLSGDELRVYGILDGQDLSIYKEKAESLQFNFDFSNNLLSFNDVKVRQSSSELIGNYKINTKSEYFEYEAKLVTGQLEDFEAYRFLNLGYSSEISGEFYGKGTLSDFSTRSHLKFTNSFLGNVQVPESLLTIYNNSKEVFSSGNFLGDRSSYNLYLNFDENNPQKSYINSFVNFKNIKELVGILSNHNMENESISGRMKGSLKSSFSVYELEKLSLEAIVDDLIFKKDDEVIRINGSRANYTIKDGAVENVNFKLISNKNNFFSLLGRGDFTNGINIRQEFRLDSSFLELFSSKVSKSSGVISGAGSINGDIDNLVFDHVFNGEKIFLNILGIPSSFSDIDFNIVFEQNSLMINKLTGQFGKGDIETKGFVKFVLPYPQIDLGLSFTNSYIPLFKKSGVLASGLAKIEGDEFPYLLNGSVTILNGTINDELQDLTPPSVSGSGVTTKYVPENKFDNKFDLFDLDLSINFDKPIVVRNLLTDLRLLGNGRVRGKLYKPTVNGVIEVVPGLSKLLFKGNEFILKEGTIVFSEDKGLVPELNFTSSSSVNQYTVNLDVYGLANNPQLNISSDPFLNQEDIFSLLTLGFTSEVSDQLEEKERRSATTLGIGTLLFDQLLKNQGLNSNLGLKLSVLPEFEENESSLLKGKSGVSESRSGRYKSATKIKLEKKISRNVDLSLASTVGGSAEQKQEMNINYNILKNVSLEGVYEINSTNEEQSKEPKSFGVDVKIQWTY